MKQHPRSAALSPAADWDPETAALSCLFTPVWLTQLTVFFSGEGIGSHDHLKSMELKLREGKKPA